MQKNTLLEVKDFAVSFPSYEDGFSLRLQQTIQNLNLKVQQGEIVAIVGASGSGKSLLADAILGILPQYAQVSGTIEYDGKVLTEADKRQLRGQEIALIPQSVNALDPLVKTKYQIQDTIKKNAASQADIFERVGLDTSVGDQYPFEISGGMKRRILVANAAVSGAKLIIADEPTPGLDSDNLANILQKLKSTVTADKGMVFITHDLAAAVEIANKIVVFYQGESVETVTVTNKAIDLEKLQHPYTKTLWQALPERHFKQKSLNKQVNNNLPALKMNHISFAYDKKAYLFKDINLTVSAGEVVGILGKSGIGKSTLGQIVSGYLTPQNGQVFIGDKTVNKFQKHPIQMIWQHPESAVNPRWKVDKILKEVGSYNQEMLNTFGIKTDWLTRYPNELSGGELQRVCILRAFLTKADFLVADEITTMLDTVTQAKIWDLLLELAGEKNIGILAISHDEILLNNIADRIIRFEDFTEIPMQKKE